MRHDQMRTAFRHFDIEAIRRLASHAVPADTLDAAAALDEVDRFNYTGCGYFLTVGQKNLPVERCTLSVPAVVCIAGDVLAGFVAFLGDHELTLECHTWGEVDVPPDFRERQVNVQTPQVDVVDLRAAKWPTRATGHKQTARASGFGQAKQHRTVNILVSAGSGRCECPLCGDVILNR